MKVRALTASSLAALALWPAAASGKAMAPAARDCRSARLDERPAGLPPAWQVALAELVAAAAETGQPWSCSDALLSLRLQETGAELVVTTPDGRVARRHVAAPEDLPAQGEALLALPSVAAPPSSPDTPAPPAPPPADRAPAAPHDPRLLLDAFAGPRFTGPYGTAWAALAVRGTIPLGAWGASLWGRYAQPVATLDDDAHLRGVSASEVALGLGVSRRFATGRFALDVSLDPALAVVSMERDYKESLPHEEGARVGLRLGVGARAHYRLSRIFRVSLAADGEVSPQDLAGARKIAPDFPAIPAYGAGVSLGVEAEIP
jgi:hypothetical protein